MKNSVSSITKVEKAYISIGASIGSGCLYCLSYHMKNARNVGLTDDEINAAISLAEKIKQRTLDKLKNYSRNLNEKAFTGVNEELPPMNKEKLLAAFGAALGTNNSDEINKLLPKATELGLSREQIATISKITRNVKKNADEICGKTVLDYFNYLSRIEQGIEAGAMCDAMHGEGKGNESNTCCDDAEDSTDSCC